MINCVDNSLNSAAAFSALPLGASRCLDIYILQTGSAAEVFYVSECARLYQEAWGGDLYAVSVPGTLDSYTDPIA